MIVERTGRIAKTHRGLSIEFARLTRDSGESDRAIWRTLPDGYRYKELADYSVDPSATVSTATAAAMIADASRFVDRVAELLAPR